MRCMRCYSAPSSVMGELYLPAAIAYLVPAPAGIRTTWSLWPPAWPHRAGAGRALDEARTLLPRGWRQPGAPRQPWLNTRPLCRAWPTPSRRRALGERFGVGQHPPVFVKKQRSVRPPPAQSATSRSGTHAE